MFDSNDILFRLQNGETPESIASEMATVLNDAVSKHEAAKQAARAASQERETKLDELATRITNDMIQYITLSDPFIGNLFEEEALDVMDVRKSLDRLIPVLSNAARLVASFEECTKEPNQKSEPKTANKDVDSLEEFLRKNGLL